MDDWQWGALLFEWDGDTLGVTRNGRLLLEMPAVTALTTELEPDPDGGERGLLRVESDRAWRAFFIDRSEVQSNLREVDASLTTLPAVLAWLLPPGFVRRQGDIGVYPRPAVPAGSALCPVESYHRALAHVLGMRHVFDFPERCAFHVADGRCFVTVRQAVHLIHPEHPPAAIAAGTYELVAARGRTLPGAVPIAMAQSSTLPL